MISSGALYAIQHSARGVPGFSTKTRTAIPGVFCFSSKSNKYSCAVGVINKFGISSATAALMFSVDIIIFPQAEVAILTEDAG